MKASVTAANVIGVAIFENKAEETPLYPDGYAVPVCTFGDAWVTVVDDVVAGAGVYINSAGAFTNEDDADGTAVDGMTYLTSAGKDGLAVVRVRK